MAVEAAFLGAAGYAIYRDVRGYFPSSTTSPPRPKRFRGEPSASNEMDDETCDPGFLPPLPPRSGLSAPFHREVKACCESLLEAKWVDSIYSGTVSAYTGTPAVQCLNDLGQGAGASQRVGNKIVMKNLKIEGFISLPAASAVDLVRLIVVIDTNCYGAACSWAQYVQGSTNNVIAFASAETVGKGKRFVPLMDKLITMQSSNGTGAGVGTETLRTFSVELPLRCSAAYSGVAGTVGDLVKNSICFIAVSGNGLCSISYQARLFYLDG